MERVDETVRRNLPDNSANDIKVNPSSRLEGGPVGMWGGGGGSMNRHVCVCLNG